MEELLLQIQTLSITQSVALVTGLIYVILAAHERGLCWLFGIVSCTLIAWDDFMHFKLYADGVLQLIYVVLGFIGLYNWRLGAAGEDKSPIVTWDIPVHARVIVASILIALPVSWLLRQYTDAAYGYLDTLTTILSLVATWMLIKKVLSNWLYWIVIDLVYVYLYWSTGGSLVALLFLVYSVVAIYAFRTWRRRFLTHESFS